MTTDASESRHGRRETARAGLLVHPLALGGIKKVFSLPFPPPMAMYIATTCHQCKGMAFLSLETAPRDRVYNV